MSRKTTNYKTIKTPDGIVFHLYEHTQGRWTPHSNTGPAVLYPKGINKPDEYYIYGIKQNYEKWFELSRIPKRSQNESGDFTE